MKEILSKAIHPPIEWTHGKYDTEYTMWTEKNKAYVACQGSLSITDWIFNLMVFTVKDHFYFYGGIYKKYKVIEDDLINFVKNNCEKEFIFTGHSQGAGMMLIAFIFIKRLFPFVKVKAILFGCPKVVNLISFFTLRKYVKDITLYEVRTDIVPHLIPTNIRLGTRIRLGENKPIWKWSIKDHYPRVYKSYME